MSIKLFETRRLGNGRMLPGIAFALFLVAIFASPRIWAQGGLEAQEQSKSAQVPTLQVCSPAVKSAITSNQAQLVGVIAVYEDGRLGACTGHQQLKPLSEFQGQGGKDLKMKRVNQITVIQGSHCMCVNGSCSC